MEEPPKVIEKKKRGRKPNSEKFKNEIMQNNSENTEKIENTENIIEAKIPKKRGRKPKGGKIIEVNKILDNKTNLESNVILHLKCNIKDIDSYIENNQFDTYQFNENKYGELTYNYLDNKKNISIDTIDNNINTNSLNTNNINTNSVNTNSVNTNSVNPNNLNPNNLNPNNNDNYSSCNNCNNCNNIKILWKKLDELTINLHNNNISDKKSACFWCTYDFDNPPIFIPKYEFNNSYHVYGCFCSPECASAFLMDENIDNATKFERYHLLNFIYSKIYDYKKNIKPAPNPLYILDKYYGNLNIQEYRQLLKNERLLLIVEKPLTRMLPELHEDNDEFMLNTNNIPSSIKYKIRKNIKNQNKSTILNDNFKVQC